MQLPAVQEGQAKPEAVLLRQQQGSWERTRRATRPHPDGGDAHRAMLPDHARSPPQGRAASVRWSCRQSLRTSPPSPLPSPGLPPMFRSSLSGERGRNPASTRTYTCVVDLGPKEDCTGLTFVCLSRAKRLVDLMVEPMRFDRIGNLGNSSTMKARL